MKAEIVSIGTELLLGSITDTNATFIARRLAALGIDCFYVSQVGDNIVRLTNVLRRAFERSDLTVTTGGLGPTQDDLTREAIAEALGESPHVDPGLEEQLRGFFRARGARMPEQNLKQAWLIPSSVAIPNAVGSAPGWWIERGVGTGKHILVSMPGVPFEMHRMWQSEVEPRLRELSGNVIVSRTLKILGLGESAVAERVADLMEGSNPTLASYAKRDGVSLRITAKAPDEETAGQLIAGLEAQVRERLGDIIYGVDEEAPLEVTGRLLSELGLRFALVEIGEGAQGAIAGLAGIDGVTGAIWVPSLEAFRATWGRSDAGLTMQEALRSLAERLGADLVLAVQVATTPEEDEVAGATRATAEVTLLRVVSGEEDVSTSTHAWRTARTEVARLSGLAALDLLRITLLKPDHEGQGA